MLSKHSILFKVLLNRFHPTSPERILKSLPEQEAKEILKSPITSKATEASFLWPRNLLKKMHYSWLGPILHEMPRDLQEMMMGALPPAQSSKLRAFLKIEQKPVALSNELKNFLLDEFFKRWKPEDVIPEEYLPPSVLQPLLALSKEQLVDLIDYLSIYDLTEAIRTIVDKKNLTNIYHCLDAKKLQFLRLCLHKKEKITVPKLDIEKWSGDVDALKQVLHRRGLFRLGKALCGQSRYFFWHLIHILDTGRGAMLSKHYQEVENPAITPLLVQQVLAVLNFLNPKSQQ